MVGPLRLASQAANRHDDKIAQRKVPKQSTLKRRLAGNRIGNHRRTNHGTRLSQFTRRFGLYH